MRPLTILAAVCALALALVLYLMLAQHSPGGSPSMARDRDRTDSASPSEPASTPSRGTPRTPVGPASREPTTEPGVTGSPSHIAGTPELGPPFVGRVLDARGQPVSSADVYLASSDRSSGIPLENLDPETLAWASRTAAKTDGVGRFQIAQPATGGLRFGIRARGFAPLDRALSTLDSVRDLGDIVLADGVVLRGRVLDSARRPVEGALVRRLDVHAKPEVILATSSGDVVATTGVDGAFRIEELATGPWMLSIKADGHPDKLERGETPERGGAVADLEIVLEDGGEIRGSVTNVPPVILPDLWIRAVPKQPAPDGRLFAGDRADEARFVVMSRRARLASDGSFTVRGLTRDVIYRLAACTGEDGLWGDARTAWVEARAGESDVHLVYAPKGALVFQVVDASTSQPVTEFEVRLGNQFMLALTDQDGSVRRAFADGRVRFEHGMEPRGGETLDLVIDARGYKTLRVADLRPLESQDLDLGVLRLERSPMVVVRVVDDATASPVVGAQVVLDEVKSADQASAMRAGASPSPASGAALRTAQTDVSGLARLNSLPGESAWLRVRHASYAPFESEIMTLPVLGDREETVRLRSGGSVVVTVEDALGVPVRGVRVRHLEAREDFGSRGVVTDGERVTDAAGKLSFTHLEAGAHRFRLEVDRDHDSRRTGGAGTELDLPLNDPASDAPMVQVTVSDGSEETATLIVPTRGRLSGRVTEGGVPLSGATLRFIQQAAAQPGPRTTGAPVDVRTNGTGAYTISSVELGAYSVSVAHPTRAMAFECEVRIAEIQARFDVDLPRTGVEGRIVDEDDRPVAGIRVRAERAPAGLDSTDGRTEAVRSTAGGASATRASAEAWGEVAVFTDSNGSYALRGVRTDGGVVIKADGGDYQPAQSDVLFVAPHEFKSGVDLKVAVGCVLEVRIAYADGSVASACRVSARRDEASGEARGTVFATTGIDGVARFRGLQPGSWRVRVEAGETDIARARTAPGEQVVVIKRGEINTVVFELP